MDRQNTDSLYDRLTEYGSSDYYGFHMPGHKRNGALLGNGLPYNIDITEIEGFDDLHHAKDILKEAQERAARVYGSEETCYLINGSTVGILSAVLGCTRRGERILMARNCHKSVYAAVYMNELRAEYIYPEYNTETGLNGAVDPQEVRRILEMEKDVRRNKKELEGVLGPVRAVVITSPTYDGVVSDVKRIAEITHAYGIPLIVDEAHGAHFGFDSFFPENANVCGADVVIHSLHKTLPALTQTALLHMNGNLADRDRIRRYVHMLQTSSPSYVLMAGIDSCIRFLEDSRDTFSAYRRRLDCLRRALRDLRVLRLIETNDFDRSKIIISTRGSGYTGKQLYEDLLEKYHLQMEMASREYVLAMTSVCDTDEGMRRLRDALTDIDRQLTRKTSPEDNRYMGALPRLQTVYTSAEAEQMADACGGEVSLPWSECAEQVSLEYAYVYPPGIPILVPGERISAEVINMLQQYAGDGFDIEGPERTGQIRCIRKIWN